VTLAKTDSSASGPTGNEDGVGFDQADQQIEDIWAAEVIERTADRAINDVSSVDAMATGLLAVRRLSMQSYSRREVTSRVQLR
jgi:hypothetical protein